MTSDDRSGHPLVVKAKTASILDAYIDGINTVSDALDTFSRAMTGRLPRPTDLEAEVNALREQMQQSLDAEILSVTAKALATFDTLEETTGVGFSDVEFVRLAKMIKEGKEQAARKLIASRYLQSKRRGGKPLGRPPKEDNKKAAYECALRVYGVLPRFKEAMEKKRKLGRANLPDSKIEKKLQSAGYEAGEVKLVMTKRSAVSAACHWVANIKDHNFDPRTVQTYYSKYRKLFPPPPPHTK